MTLRTIQLLNVCFLLPNFLIILSTSYVKVHVRILGEYETDFFSFVSKKNMYITYVPIFFLYHVSTLENFIACEMRKLKHSSKKKPCYRHD